MDVFHEIKHMLLSRRKKRKDHILIKKYRKLWDWETIIELFELSSEKEKVWIFFVNQEWKWMDMAVHNEKEPFDGIQK